MPSPIGHALAGIAIAWTADVVQVRRSRTAPVGHRSAMPPRLVALCAGLAMLPDADLLIPGTHRTMTHSLTAAVLVFIVAAAVTGRVTPVSGGVWHVWGRWRVPVLCTIAYASHLLLDWLGADRFPPRGIQLLWPFSDRWFISDWDIFRQTARQHFLTPPIIRQNAIAVAQELAILLPIVLVVWLVRVKTTARLAAEMSRRHHPTQ